MQLGAITLGIVIVFIIILVSSFVYKRVAENDKVKKWPPHIAQCPEYWEINSTDNTRCINKTGINGTLNDGMDAYDGSNMSEVKAQSQYNTWDGLM